MDNEILILIIIFITILYFIYSSDKSQNNESNEQVDQISIDTTKVDIVGIKMPFLEMVEFMVKWTIASIPAIFLLSLLLFMFDAFFRLL